MHGFIANTDFEWYEFLRRRPDLDEVNFWAPSGRAVMRSIQPGEPFFFRLKKPHYRIAGFGYFVHASTVPLSLAWEAFEDKNGAADLPSMRGRVLKYRAKAVAAAQNPSIGCRMITSPTFFPPDLWVDSPRDWKANVVVGATYDLTAGEGQRIWRSCLDRSQAMHPKAIGTSDDTSARYGTPTILQTRLGQGSFRIAVADAYNRSCAVTTEHSLPVLEAAHIRQYSDGGSHQVSNGLLLRADLHRLFDRGYVTVDPDYRFRVSQRLRDEWHNGRVYYELDGREILRPDRAADWPDRTALEHHCQRVFLQ